MSLSYSKTFYTFTVVFLVSIFFQMEDLEVSGEIESTKKHQKSKEKIKKELEESLFNSEKHNNTEIEVKAKNVERPEDASKVI